MSCSFLEQSAGIAASFPHPEILGRKAEKENCTDQQREESGEEDKPGQFRRAPEWDPRVPSFVPPFQVAVFLDYGASEVAGSQGFKPRRRSVCARRFIYTIS
jgi:hypothetical protein